MTYPYWTVIEVAPMEWWAVDTSSGTAFCMPEQTGERLWRSHALLERPLLAALEDGGGEEADAFVDLDFLGVAVRYLCDDATVPERIATLYAAMLPELRRSPDVLVRIGSTADFDRLHRSVSGNRPGVEVRAVASKEWSPGSPDLPIIPPMQSPSLSGRFCALHAALLKTSAGGVLICGAQRTGKTSAALLASRLGFANILADEMVLIDIRGKAFGVPLPVRERTVGGREAWSIARNCRDDIDGVSVGTVILLESAEGYPSWTRVVGIAERMRLMTAHMRVLDGPVGRATASVLGMLRGAEVWRWSQRQWPLLAEDLEHGFRNLLETKYGD